MIVLMAALALAQQPADTATAAGRPCTVVIDSIGGYYRQNITQPGDTNRFAGGGVLAHCKGTGSTLAADSIAYYAAARRVDLVGRVHIRDTALTLDATTAAYFLRQERLEAHRNVVAVNRETGSVLTGPNLTYWRVAKGVRDTMEMFASSRPTIEYRAQDDSAAEPYLIVGDRVRFKGNDRVWGGGNVTIDRSDLAARADSMALDEAAGFGVLVGKPRVEGKAGKPYTLVGTRIELGLRSREIERVKALGAGEATGDDWHLTADTIHLAVLRRKLQQAFAWGDSSRPHAISTEHTIQADSLALDTPDEVLREIRAFGRAFSTSRRDTTTATADLDWIAGDTVIATFEPASASAGADLELRNLVARGTARSFTHLYDAANGSAGGGSPPSLNYSRGARIAIALKGDKIDRVVVSGKADGVHLEPVPPPPVPPDTTKIPPLPPLR
ncbi:MAG: hypothetical protein ACREL9_00570 [Gemmatimonadales bacterium]